MELRTSHASQVARPWVAVVFGRDERGRFVSISDEPTCLGGAADADLADCTAGLAEPDRIRLHAYWSRVVEDACASLPATPRAAATDGHRRTRRKVRQRTNRLVRVLPAANRTCTEPTPEEEAA